VLCLVHQWAALVQHISAYPGLMTSTTVNTVMNQMGISLLSHQPNCWSAKLLNKLHSSITAIGLEAFGFSANEVGLHSIWSRAAMAMYLNKIPVYTIMLVGRWSSDAFLWYNQKMVQEFIIGVSSAMITTDDFFTIPEISAEDPCTSGHHLNLSLHNNCGRDTISNLMMSWFALFH